MFKYIQACKGILWKRWKLECLLAQCERHNYANGKNPSVKFGDILQIKGEIKNRGEWKISLITKAIFVNNILVDTKIKLENNTLLELPVQIFYPLGIFHDVMNNEDISQKSL